MFFDDLQDSFDGFLKSKAEAVEKKEEERKEKYESKFLLSDDEISELGVKKSDIEMYRRMHYQNAFNVNSWYGQMENETFRSAFLPISFQEGREIYNVHLKKVSVGENEVLSNLEKKIHQAIKDLVGEGSVFIKLATRSPKVTNIDSIMEDTDTMVTMGYTDILFFLIFLCFSKDVPTYDFDNVNLRKLIEQRLDEIDYENLPDENSKRNREVAAFVSASQDYLEVKDGSHAMDLLLRSMRVSEDLSKALRFDEKLWNVSLVLREWMPKVIRYL